MRDFEALIRPLDQENLGENGNLSALSFEQKPADVRQQQRDLTANCVEQGLLPNCTFLQSSDTSGEMRQVASSSDKSGPAISRDSSGRITSVEHANGVRYDFQNFDRNGQPTCIRITRAGDKDYGEWIRENDGLWRAYHNGKPTSEVIVGEWRVNEKGELSHTGHQEMRSVSRDKSVRSDKDGAAEKFDRASDSTPRSESYEATGHTLRRNADGKVTEVTRANGETTKFKYAADGRVSEVTLPSGTVLTTTDGTHWKNSQTGKTSELTVEVKNDGTYSLEQNGKKVVLLPNGNAVRSDVSPGSPDRVTSVTHADGQTTSFKYSADGKVNEVTLPAGTVLTTTDGGKTWMNSETGNSSNLKVEVKSDGTYSLEQNGKKAVLSPDGSVVRMDVPAGAPERITSVAHANGQTSEFKYGQDGKLTEVKLPGGTVLTTTDGKTWTNSETGQASEMRIDVAADGSYTIERDGKMAVIRPDGSSEPFVRSLEEPGKVKERHAAGSRAGHPYEEIVYEDGTVRQLHPGGVTVEIRKDMTITEKPDHSVAVDINGDTRVAKPLHPERGFKRTTVDERGNVTYEYQDGTSSVHLRGGGIEDIAKNGDSKLYLGGEVIQETKKQSDQSVVTSSDGRVTSTEHPKVNRVFRYDNKGDLQEVVGTNGTWKRMTGPDGKEYWQNEENPDLKWHGKMSVDKQGNLHYKPHDAHASAWIFTRDGRDLAVARGPRASGSKDGTGKQARGPISVDTSVPVPRDLFEKEGTPASVR